MIVSEKEFKEMYKEIDGVSFSPIADLIVEKVETDEKDKSQRVFKYKILKTADEVYQEYLENKDKPVVEEPSTQEKINSLEDDNASLLLDLADKDARIKQLENDFADLLLNLGGDK